MSNPSISADIDQSARDNIKNKYIVILKSKQSLGDHMDWVKERDDDGLDSAEWSDIHKYESLGGYEAKLSDSAIEGLRDRSDVQTVVQDRFGTLDVDDNPPVNINVASGAPWNLQRLSSREALGTNADPDALNYNYTYRHQVTTQTKSNLVHVYVLDTGIKLGHEEFDGREFIQGPNYSDEINENDDTHGHGTHVAGTIGGNNCGVARDPAVHVTVVKVLSGNKSIDNKPAVRLGATLWGILWVLEQREQHPEIPTILSMSLKFAPGDDVLDDYVNMAVASGVHVVVSAGNAGEDAMSQSPARARDALAVGGSTIRDGPYVDTNFGPKVAIFAPGVDIMSAGIKTRTELVSKTGTSMATPLVAGTIAYLIQQEGERTPKAMLQRLQELADSSGRVVKGVPANTSNRLIWNGAQ